MRVIINKEEILELINELMGTSSAGWGKNGSIIIDQTLEEIVKTEDNNEYNGQILSRYIPSNGKLGKSGMIKNILDKAL